MFGRHKDGGVVQEAMLDVTEIHGQADVLGHGRSTERGEGREGEGAGEREGGREGDRGEGREEGREGEGAHTIVVMFVP